MALVDYECSTESEDDEPKNMVDTSPRMINNSNGVTVQGLFDTLPPPIKNDSVVEEEIDEFLQKKADIIEKPPKRIKISIPELSTFIEDPELDCIPHIEKKPKSGLFVLLPTPKVAPLKNTCFIPNSLQKQSQVNPSNIKSPATIPHTASTQSVTKTTITSTSAKKPQIKPVLDSDTEDEDNDAIPITEFDEQTWDTLFSKKKRIAVPGVKKPVALTPKEEQSVINLAPETEKPYKGLDNDAFKELFGHRIKPEKITLIDVEEAKIHPDRDEWLKSLTDPNFEASPEIKTPINHTSLVKNHITSLAERALANDKDLQIRWAESRHSRNQTRTKYGF